MNKCLRCKTAVAIRDKRCAACIVPSLQEDIESAVRGHATIFGPDEAFGIVEACGPLWPWSHGDAELHEFSLDLLADMKGL